MKRLIFAWFLALLPVVVTAAGTVHLDRAPNLQGDKAALQEGAALFVNYCLGCHGASFLRHNKLLELGLTKEQIERNLMFTAEKIGDPMRTALRSGDGKKWFGVKPPDLTLVARARASEAGSGADWLYTYLRSFYRDPETLTGWNNKIFANVAMPHVLWQMQGDQVLGEGGYLQQMKPGTLSATQYDEKISRLVGFMVWMAEPDAAFQKRIGIGVLIFLAFFSVFAYALKKEYWKDVH